MAPAVGLAIPAEDGRELSAEAGSQRDHRDSRQKDAVAVVLTVAAEMRSDEN